VEQVQKAGATILFSEQESLSLDSPEGRMLVSILSSFAAFEADMISARTKAALQHVQAHGSKSGRPVGNPSCRRCPEPVAALIRQLRDQGDSFSRIAAELNERGIPTVQGAASWRHGAVRNILLRQVA
jgi:DNA invertase Pin-like site-specific DNA recombinase